MKKYVVSLFLILAIIFSGNVYAASVSASASKTSLNVGDEFNVNINLTGASVATLTVKLSVDTSKVEYVSGPTNSNFSGGKVIYTWTDSTGGSSPLTGGTIATFKFRAKDKGTANFSLTGEFYDVDENSINMALSGTNITITEKVDTPTQTGETQSINEATNSQTVPNGTTTNNIQSNLSSNTNLKTMQLSAEGISPAFNKNTMEYWLVVDKTIDNIDVVAAPEDGSSTVNISGNQNLQIGSNKIVITVTAQNGSKKSYIINVTKAEDMDSANANLENLAIENAVLIPEFSAEITEYFVDVESEIDTINILAIPQIEGATVNIDKPETLDYGENIVEITVVAKDGITQKKYTINVNRKNVDETQENTPKSKKILYICLTIGLIVIIGIIIFFILRYIKKKKVV